MKASLPPFRLLCRGCWPPAQVNVVFQDHFHVLPPPHARQAAAFWQELVATSGNHLYNGELFRLEKFSASPQLLELRLTRTCYRDQLYNNARLRELGEAQATRGLGISAIVITSDNCTPIIRRSLHLGEAPGMLDVIGGHAHPHLHLRGGRPDLFAAMAEEVTAELGLQPEAVAVESCTGMVENPVTLKPDLVFLVRLRCTMAEVRQLVAHAREAEEFTELLAVQVSAVREFCAARHAELTAPALGCLTILASL
ncbi:MAG: hypothetical protein ONB48_04190 [candidate division KSB1 bacterium]|nr:hypothetical protein [candidate division KSB1 bacterium]MDZ7274489.1 hypothetical protein [candidate division KSB1 bacterium]MDZ7284849.1 hypothetical protein [candidate division KSB1 bacterium]MDZ7297731.1 hypothetical protein [candidate division KSB1 bacterium]MDZ7307594.1 hypothetical protein [candidate division KSB1 bacterium]